MRAHVAGGDDRIGLTGDVASGFDVGGASAFQRVRKLRGLRVGASRLCHDRTRLRRLDDERANIARVVSNEALILQGATAGEFARNGRRRLLLDAADRVDDFDFAAEDRRT